MFTAHGPRYTVFFTPVFLCLPEKIKEQGERRNRFVLVALNLRCSGPPSELVVQVVLSTLLIGTYPFRAPCMNFPDCHLTMVGEGSISEEFASDWLASVSLVSFWVKIGMF